MLPILRSDFWRPVRRAYAGPVENLWDEMDQFIGRFLREGLGHESAFHPALEVAEDTHAVHIRAEMPGVDPKDIHVELADGVLMIYGEKKEEAKGEKEGNQWSERRYGSFSRSISLPVYVEADKVEAACKDGVLTITLPKTEKAKPKQIAVKVS